MATVLQSQLVVTQANENGQSFSQDERLRILDEAHQQFLHDKSTDIEEAHEKGIALGEIRGEIKTILRLRFGNLPDALTKRIAQVGDLPTLMALGKIASACDTLNEFAEMMT